MWIQFNDEQLEALKVLVAAGQTKAVGSIINGMATIIEERIAHYEAPDAHDERFINAIMTNDVLEVDEDAVTSIGNDGAFVLTWTWVSNEDAGISYDEDEDNFCPGCGIEIGGDHSKDCDAIDDNNEEHPDGDDPSD